MDLLLRLQADLLGVPAWFGRPCGDHCLGAAWWAGLAEGVWGSLGELAAAGTPTPPSSPGADSDAADSSYQGWLEAVRRSMAWNQP